MLETLAGVIVGAVIGFGGTYVLEVTREKRQREGDKKAIAGALAAEVRGILERWDEIKARRKPFEKGKHNNPRLLALSSLLGPAQESYFSVFDGAGPRLHLLPSELVTETVTCYVRVKAVMDGLRAVTHIVEQAALANPSRFAELSNMATDTDRRIMEYAEDTVAALQALVVKLDAAAR